MSRVLLVDDDDDALVLLAQLLERRGHQIASARSLADAKRTLAETNGFDLIVTDLELGDGSGLELCEPLTDGMCSHNVVLLTGHMKVTVPPNVRVLTKPVDPATLLRLVSASAGARA
jgi:DNA-binding NtrC family response regulator